MVSTDTLQTLKKAETAAQALRNGVAMAERRGQALALVPLRDATYLVAFVEMVGDALRRGAQRTEGASGLVHHRDDGPRIHSARKHDEENADA